MKPEKCFSIAITGGIGSGKSSVIELIRKKGFETISADRIGHDLLENEEVKAKIVKEFGDSIMTNGRIERRKLADTVFPNKTALMKLNSILHPKIIDEIKQFMICSAGKIVFFEVPLLYEAGIENLFRLTVNIEAKPEIRKKRLTAKSYLTEKEVEERFASQLRDEFKREKADVTIRNNSTKEALSLQIEVMLQLLQRVIVPGED